MFVKLLPIDGNVIGIMRRSVYLGRVYARTRSPGVRRKVWRLDTGRHLNSTMIQTANLCYVSFMQSLDDDHVAVS